MRHFNCQRKALVLQSLEMKVTATLASEKNAPASPPKVRRTRVHPTPFRIVWGALLLFIAFLAFLSFAWFTGELLLKGDRADGYIALGSLGLFGLCRLFAFLNNEKLHCTLCHGTVLHEKRCRKHADAVRIPGLSHRAATVASVLCTGGFRCMYCGTPYRLKK
jgi:hypothetical protein